MNVIEEETETTEPITTAIESSADAHRAGESEPEDAAPDDVTLLDAPLEAQAATSDENVRAEGERPTRRKLEEQLEALKRKEVELRRALVMADHPELADSIRILQGRTYALERVEAKLAQGLSKAELRRRETLEKKRQSLLEKRAELDAQITGVDSELHSLGAERQQGFDNERRQALEELLIALGTHDPSLHAAGIEATELVPEIARWLPEIEALAETLATHKSQVN